MKYARLYKTMAVLVSTFVAFTAIVGFYSDPVVLFSQTPPTGYTGAGPEACNSCHADYDLNSGGGGVDFINLPAANYDSGKTYNFSVQITHGEANRKRWGFSMIALDANGVPAGTFSSVNANAKTNGSELSHFKAVVTGAQGSFTYSGLSWTAPAHPTAAQRNINFYIAGNAANNDLSNSGDFIYTNSLTLSIALPTIFTFSGNGFWTTASNWANNAIPPATLNETGAKIIISPAANGECVLNTAQTVSNGASLTISPGARFRVTSGVNIK